MKVLFVFAVTGFLFWDAQAIRGGSTTNALNNPHLVSISIGDEFACAGSLLTLDWVVTIASCVKDIPTNKFVVRAGSWKTDALGQTRGVDSVIVYPMFNWYTQDYDLALVKLTQPFVKGRKVHPIELAKDPIAKGEKFTVAGWGENTVGDVGDMRKLPITLLSHEDCTEKYQYDVFSSRMLCSYMGSHDSPCWNDFGDPLKNQWGHLVGMYTWSRECTFNPSVYTYLYPYREWIATAVPELRFGSKMEYHVTGRMNMTEN